MPLINLMIAMVVIGLLLWLVNSYKPMVRKIKQILNVVRVLCAVAWLLFVFTFVHLWRSGDIGVPKIY